MTSYKTDMELMLISVFFVDKMKLLFVYFSSVYMLKLYGLMFMFIYPKILHLQDFTHKDIVYGLIMDNNDLFFLLHLFWYNIIVAILLFILLSEIVK